MTVEKLKQAVGEIRNCRQDVIDRLVQFAPTDSLLFWGNNDELIKKQEQLWNPILNWANREINAKYITTRDLNVPEQDPYSLSNLKNFMENLSDKELAAFYLAAVNTKSELLAAALVKGQPGRTVAVRTLGPGKHFRAAASGSETGIARY